LRELITELENIIIRRFRPTFLSIHAGDTETPRFIHVVVSVSSFSEMPVDKRVVMVYKGIRDENPDLLDKIPIIIETFSSTEMVDLFEYFK
jgi:hypothetical protein